jgi:hypothetical protein
VATAEAGDVAHVYFLDRDEPATIEDLRREHPGVLEALRDTRAVGIVAVRGGRRGIAIVRGDEIDLADADEVARLPHPQPELAGEYLADLLALPASGDLVVQGWRGEGRKPVAYAWEFGSHGGIAPEEIDTFVVSPRGCAFRFDQVRRPSELYDFFASAYREHSQAPRLPPREHPPAEPPAPARTDAGAVSSSRTPAGREGRETG